MRTHTATSRYAAVASTLALFVAIGGTSYAATQITGKQIKNNTVTTKDIKDATLTSADLAPGTVAQGPAGPAGSQGPAGPAGAPGPSNAWYAFNQGTTVLTGATKTVLSIDLPAGSFVVNAKATAERRGGSGQLQAVCQIAVNGGAFDSAVATIPATTGFYQAMSMQLAFTQASAGPARLECYDLDSGTDTGVYRKQLTAIKVGTLASTEAPDVARMASSPAAP